MNITIDGKSIEILPADKNIVDTADRAGIGIPAPCYRATERKSCCQGCVVEINGEQKYACCTAPVDGMVIILNRPDLKELRKERLLNYQQGIATDNPCQCDCSCDSNCC